RSPVQRRVFVEGLQEIPEVTAGLSALAEKTMLNAPPRQIRAVTSKELKDLRKDKDFRVVPESAYGLATLELEVWRYDPRLLGEKGVVDPLSLYLSLVDTDDERVEGALNDL